jgi:hypothetical protein
LQRLFETYYDYPLAGMKQKESFFVRCREMNVLMHLNEKCVVNPTYGDEAKLNIHSRET